MADFHYMLPFIERSNISAITIKSSFKEEESGDNACAGAMPPCPKDESSRVFRFAPQTDA
jgi:hypothetical protein